MVPKSNEPGFDGQMTGAVPGDASLVELWSSNRAVELSELQGWLAHVQESLQKTMDDVTKRLEQTKAMADLNCTKLEFARVLNESPEQQEARVLRDAVDELEKTPKPPQVHGATESSDTVVIVEEEEPPLPKPAPVKLESSRSQLPETAEMKASLPQLPGQVEDPPPPGKSNKKPGQPGKIEVSDSNLSKSSSSPLSPTAPGRTVSQSPKASFIKRLRACLCFCRCPARCKPKKKNSFPLKPAQPVPFLGLDGLYTQEENAIEPLGKKLKGMRKMKAVPTKLWEPRVLLHDANGKKFSLKAVEDAKNHDDMAFPVKVQWKYLDKEELYKATWRDMWWWKKTGIMDNLALRSLSMRVHARMHHCACQVTLLTEGLIKDVERSLQENTTLMQQTQDYEIEMALDAISDIDDLLIIDFRIDELKVTIGQVAQAAGCPWDAFVDAYMHGRNSAINNKGEGRRRELILAAAKGMDGLEQLYGHLCNKIDANDLFIFKVAILCLNGVTAAAQFAWSDFLVPEMYPPTTTAAPTWQSQISKIYAATAGG